MVINAIDESQRKAARIAGLAFPLSFITLLAVNYGIFVRLIVSGNAQETARNLVAHETLFRIGIAGNMVYCVGAVVLLTALYIILRPVNQNIALLATFCRLVNVVTWLLVTLNLFTALRLLTDASYARALGPDQLPALVKLHLSGYDAYYIGLLFWALAAFAGSYVWFKSNYIPRSLAAVGLVSSGWCAACTFVYYISPSFANLVSLSWFDSPMLIFELVLGSWLLFRGLRPSVVVEAE